MNYINEKEFKISGILNWHKKGYTGKGVRIANIEKCNIDAWYLKDMVNDPFSNAKQEKENSHGNQTLNMISQVSPDAKFYTLPRGGRYTNDKAEGNLIDKTIPFIISENICLVNASFGGVNNKPLNEAILKAQKHGATFICSAGNSGDKGTSPYARSGVWISVGAVSLTNQNEVKLATYSSIDEHVDFVQFGGLYVNDIKNKDRVMYCTGTSFSSPLLLGMLALVQQFFLEKTNKTLNQEQIYRFIIDNSIDLGEKGKDDMFGHGLFILPNPEDIIIKDYVNVSDNNIGDDIMDFKDVDKNRWSAKNIDLVSDLGLMNGYPDGTFKPAQPVTREEIATVLANLVNNFNVKQK